MDMGVEIVSNDKEGLMRSLIRKRKTLHIALLQIVLAAVVFAMAVPTSASNSRR